jgi:putative sigma-54 modulation protein
MNVYVRFRGLQASPEVAELVSQRVNERLGRFASQLTSVLVRISDINGPKGGVDKRCQVTVQGPRFGVATFENLSADVPSAIEAAFDRLAHVVRRIFERRRSAVRPDRDLGHRLGWSLLR